MKKFILALPLLSLVVLAGCCTTDTCSPCTAVATTDTTTSVVVAQADKAPAAKTHKGIPVLSQAEYEKLLSEGRVTRIGETTTVAQTTKAPARKVSARTTGRAVIPTVKLPEGWSYISEAEVVAAPVQDTVAAVEKESQDS